MEIHPRVGVLKEEKFPNTRKPSHQRVCGEFWNPRGKYNLEEKQIKATDYLPNGNSQQRSTSDAHIHHQQVGVEQGGLGCVA